MKNKLFVSFALSITLAPFALAMEQEAALTPIAQENMLTSEQQESLNKQLVAAIENNYGRTIDLVLVEQLLNQGANPNVKNLDEYSVLVRAAEAGNLELAKLLLEHGADINAQSGRRGLDSTAMHRVIVGSWWFKDWMLGANSVLSVIRTQKEVQFYDLLLEYGAKLDIKNINQHTPLMWNADLKSIHSCKALITRAIFNPYISQKKFQESRERIWAALCGFKRMCPNMPKDLRKLILRYYPELAQDLACTAACGAYKGREDQAPFLPLSAVRLLLQNGQFDSEKTVAAIKAHHFACIAPLMVQAIPQAAYIGQFDEPAKRLALLALLDPNLLEENHGAEIERNIRRRLGISTWSDSAVALVPSNPCVVQ